MSDTPNKHRALDCRRRALHHLAVCSSIARDVDSIRRGLSPGYEEFTPAEVKEAVDFLVGAGWVSAIQSRFGGEFFYQITTPGKVADETDAP